MEKKGWKKGMEFILGYPTGVPLGGIGTGIIELRSDGRVGTVICNHNWSHPFTETPGCFFAVKLKNGAGKEEVRLLQDGEDGMLRGMDRVRFQAEYPFAKATYTCIDPAFAAELTAFCPNVPHDREDSSVPGAKLEFALHNYERTPVTYQLYISWEHLSGCGALPDGTVICDRTGNRITTVSDQNNTGLLFLPGTGAEALPNSIGEYALLTKHQEKVKTSLHWWNVLDGQEGFLKAIEEDFAVADGDVPLGAEGSCHPAGVLEFEISLNPGERVVLPVALSWYLPHHFAGGAAGMDDEMRKRLAPMLEKEENCSYTDGETKDFGHFYNNRFSGAKEVAQYLLEHGVELEKKSRELSDFLKKTDLPEWLAKKLVNDDAPLSCNSILTKDGTLATLEAARGMGGALGTNDQRLVAHAAYQLFFPKLNRTELRLFAKVQAEDGHIPHFCGNVHQDIGSCQVSYGDTQWPDLSCSFIFQCWRDYQCTGDSSFFMEMLPHIRRAYEWLKRADQDKDGVPEGGSTWDVEPHEGLFSFTGSIWLATLRILEKAAEKIGDAQWKAETQEWFAKAQKSVLALYNGEYFNMLHNPVNGKTSDDIFVGQAAGEWMVRLLGLESVLPEKMVRSSLKAIYRTAANPDNYMLAPIKVTKEGNLVQRDCAEQAWPQYTMVYTDCLAMYLGMDEGMKNLRHFDEVVTELIKAPCTTTLWHNAVTGLPNWGSIDRYMNTPAVWFVLNALTGFHPALAEKAIHLDIGGYGFERGAVLPLISTNFWATAQVKRTCAMQKIVHIVFDKLYDCVPLAKLELEGCSDVAAVLWNGQEVAFELSGDGKLIVTFDEHDVKAGDELVLQVVETKGKRTPEGVENVSQSAA